jgi:hypothetical protein
LCKAAKKEGIEFINPEKKDALEKLDKILSYQIHQEHFIQYPLKLIINDQNIDNYF